MDTQNHVDLTKETAPYQNDLDRSFMPFDHDRSETSLTNPPIHAASIEDIPPNGGYGWVCTLCVFMANAHTWGLNGAWGVFLAHYLSKSAFNGASHLEYALIGGLSISQALLSVPLVAKSTAHLGTRITMLFGTLLLSIALLGASYATKIWHLFLSQGVGFGLAMGFIYIPATAALPQWFSSRRSLAMGIASSGAGLGGLAYNLVAGHIIQTLGVSWAYRILAFCGLVGNLLCALLLKDRNLQVRPQSKAFNYREYRHVEVILLVLWGFFSDLGYIVLLYSLPNYASFVGLTSRQGSVVGAIFNLGLGLGRPAIGYFSDSFGRLNMASAATMLSGILCFTIWIPAKSYGLLLTFAVFSGSVCGIFWNTITPVTAEIVGLQRLPSTFGVVLFALVIPSTFAEPMALELAAAAGYVTSQIFVGCMFLLAALSACILRCWKIHQIEDKALRERLSSDHQAVGLLNRPKFWLNWQNLIWLGRV